MTLVLIMVKQFIHKNKGKTSLTFILIFFFSFLIFFFKFNKVCEEKILLEQEAHSQIRSFVLGIFFLSLLFVGIGQTAVSTLGIPYIDDNVASKESAIYIGKFSIVTFFFFFISSHN